MIGFVTWAPEDVNNATRWLHDKANHVSENTLHNYIALLLYH